MNDLDVMNDRVVVYYPYESQQYQPQTFLAVLQALMGLMMLVAMGVFVFSQMKKAWRGEEVEPPQASVFKIG
jgi:hypothetical protein